MSGIFKGDSIYKGGGGGGGYKDGGQLVDGDFIKVENNTISSYDNVSRDPVNFYFEVKDGEILNSVVELTTAVNATINVYVVKNGFYYLLGNVGGNTVNAGDDYKVNITGDSYAVEQVTTAGNDPLLPINGGLYKVSFLNDIGLAFTENLNENVTGSYAYNNDVENTKNGYGRIYNTRYVLNSSGGLVLPFAVPSGWRIPTKNDFQKILDFYNTNDKFKSLVADHDWSNPGTNTTGFNLLPTGKGEGYPDINTFKFRGSTSYIMGGIYSGRMYYFQSNGSRGGTTIQSSEFWYQSYVSQTGYPVRLCRDI
jgi:uncharacterized protein (TIGR02145 family)